MFFKSDTKEIKNIVIEAINECILSFADNVEAIEGEYEGEQLEAQIYFEKKRHLFDVLEKATAKMEKRNPGCSDNIVYLASGEEDCGYEIDTENGFLAGGVYAICYTAATGKKCDIGDCADLNAKHAMLIQRVLDR